MGNIASLDYSEPPDHWSLFQYDEYIRLLIRMYKDVYLFMKMQDEEKFNIAEELFERIWVFRDARLAKFLTAKDQWLLLEGSI